MIAMKYYFRFFVNSGPQQALTGVFPPGVRGPRRQQGRPHAVPFRNLRDVRPRHVRLGDGLLLLRHRPRSTARLRRPQSAVITFHYALQHTAHAARETYAIEELQSMRPDRTVTS